MSEPLDLIVVGAGVSGLAAAWRAKAAGKRVLVLEASPRAGGVIRTERVGGYRVERAASSFPSTAKNILDAVATLPDPPRIHEPRPEVGRQFLLARRGLVEVKRSPAAMVRSGLLGPGAAMRAIFEFARGPRRAPRSESAHAFVTRRFGRGVADRLLAPMTLGIYGASPTELGAADAFPALAEMERASGGVLRALTKRKGAAARRILTFEGGMESLPRALAAALGSDLRFSTAVEAIGVDADGAYVATSAEALRAKEILLAVRAPDQARLLAPLSSAAAEILAAVRYVPMVVVAVGIPPGGAPAIPPAFGFLRGRGTPVRILGASFPSMLDPSAAPEGHSLLTVFLGGSSDPTATALSDAEVASIVERDLAFALRGRVAPDMVSIQRYERAIPVLAPGHRARMATAQTLLASSVRAAAGAGASPHSIRLWASHVSGVAVDACCGVAAVNLRA